MTESYWDSPVTPIVIFVGALAIAIGVTVTVSARRKRKRIEAEKERKRMERRVADRLAAEREARPARTIRPVPLKRSAKTNMYRPQPRKPSSIPAPGRPGFRQDDPSVDSLNNMLMAGLLFDSLNHASENSDNNHHTPSYDPSPSPSYDSGSSSSSYDGGSSSSSSDSGSSSSFDGGGSFSGGDSGSF